MSSPSKFVIKDEAWSQDISQKFSDYMENCSELIFCPELPLDEPESTFQTESGEPYCGCSDCDTREVLFFLIPRILEAYKEGKVDLA